MRRIFAAFALVIGLSSPAAAQYTFTDWIETSVYYGCVDTRSCHRLTVQYGPIGPEPVELGLNNGMRYLIESWFYVRGGTSWPLREVVLPTIPGTNFIGTEMTWEDGGGFSYCHMPSCVGYNVDDFYWRMPLPVWDNYVPRDQYKFTMAYLVGDGPMETDPASTWLTLVSRTQTTVPEPSTYAMFAAGLLALVVLRRRATPAVRADQDRYR